MEQMLRRTRTDASERFAAFAQSAQETSTAVIAAAQRHRERAETVVADQVAPAVQRSVEQGQRGVEQVAAAAQKGYAEQVAPRAEQFASAAQESAGQMSVAAQKSAGQMSVAAQKGAEQVTHGAGMMAVTVESWRTSIGESLPRPTRTVVRPKHADAAEDVDPFSRTRPPVRLRMISADHLAHRSMELEWENGTGQRQMWTSYQDPLCSWFDAEKVLPASVTDLSVRFKIHMPTSKKFVEKVDRYDNCKLVRDDQGNVFFETIWFYRVGSNDGAIDATFELRGLPNECHVSRAWNAAPRDTSAAGAVEPALVVDGPLFGPRDSSTAGAFEQPEPWECWEDRNSRPGRTPRLEILRAADLAARLSDARDPVEFCAFATRRLVAAAKVVQELRRQTLPQLSGLNGDLTGQWVAVNGTHTLSAGLAVASAAALFVAPPVALGLGLGSAATGGAASVGDSLADAAARIDLRQLLCDADMSTLAIADLQQEWLRSRDHAGEALRTSSASAACLANAEQLRLYSTNIVQMSIGFASTVVNLGQDASLAAVGGSASASSASVANGARAAVPVAARALGVAGAVLSTGVAVHGWATTKTLQAIVQKRVSELNSSTLDTQRWLSAMSELDCTICLCSIELTDEVRCCSQSWHYSHARCLDLWENECSRSGREASCPMCCGPLATHRGRLEQLLTSDISRLLEKTSV